MHLDINNEIDFGGLVNYLNTSLLYEIKLYLFDIESDKIAFYKDIILVNSYNYAKADNDMKRNIVKNFIDTILTIVKKYYIKSLDCKEILLLNITRESILNNLTLEL